VTQLVGKRLADAPRLPAAPAIRDAARSATPRTETAAAAVFVYDEWDHLIDDYRPRWCTLREVELPGDSGLYFDEALGRHAELVPEVRRHFQRLRPERYRRVHGLEDGETIDLNAVVDARVQHRARRPGSAKLYASRRREERDVATLFLVDLSASTDETAPGADHRIIDITKDALVIMTAALEEIGDLYAVYGFSGQGRDRVEVYPVKSFAERLTPAVQGRIGGLEPRGSTRMGTALRHALARMAGVAAPSRHLILLSDGFPQDLDYGSDRASHAYGIRDTAVALREVQHAGVRPFCITVDLSGHDYLRQMCAPEQYLVIEAVGDLPRQLPKIYQRLIRAA
jgi:nitric oxide reductase activation protein